MTASSKSARWRAIQARRAKIAVISKDSSIDPVGACVGMRGVRVQAVVQELQGERIDIIPWNPEAATFIVNALAPAEVSKVVLDEDTHRVEVVVPDEQLSLAIGRRGQNVRLASQLTGWQIDILTEAEESERRQKEFAERTKLFMEALDVDETVAQLLASEGFAEVEDVAYVPLADLSAIEGFDEETAEELQNRAIDHIEAQNKALDDKRRELGVGDDLMAVEGITAAMAVALGEHEVKSLEDIAGCATDDLLGYYDVNKEKERVRVPGALEGFDLTPDDANAIIMAARVKAGWIESAGGRRRPPKTKRWPKRRRKQPTHDARSGHHGTGNRFARTALHRHGRSVARGQARPFRRRSRWPHRSRRGGEAAGPRHLGIGGACMR